MSLTQEQIDACGPPAELSRLFAQAEPREKVFDEDGPPTLWSSHLPAIEHPSITQEMIDAMGTPEGLLRMFECYRRASEFLQCHEREFAALYPNEWVAVTESELIAHSADFEDVHAAVGERGLPSEAVARRFLRDSDTILIL